MKNLTQFYINGSWQDPDSTEVADVINPATESVCATVALGNNHDMDQAVAAAKQASMTWMNSSREQRIALLERIVAAYKAHYGDLAEAVRLEMGAPVGWAKNAQAGSGLGHLQTTLSILKNFEFDRSVGSHQEVLEPVGVVGLITPWNWPLNQLLCKVAPALAAGCTMVLKPSEVAPLSAHIVAQIMHDAETPAGVFNMVHGVGANIGDHLAGHADIDMVSFTGSTRAGASVSARAATTIKRVALELGGKSANIILEDADFGKAVSGGVIACFSNTGQSCNAPTRMLVPRSRMSEVIDIAKATAEKVSRGVGDPTLESTQIGPVSNRAQFERVQANIQTGIDEGAELIAGGVGRPAGFDKGFFVQPTIFANVSNDMTIAQQEIFGPVLVIIPYEDEEDAIAIANDSVYGLSGYVFGEPEHAKRIARRLRTGMVHLNGAGPDFTAPFGGYKQSGNGREWGVHGLMDFLETKAIIG